MKIDLTQGTPEWLDFRKNKIGSSDISVIINESPYKKRSELLREKLTGETKEISDFTKEIFTQGHDWEIVVRDSINQDFEPAVFQAKNTPHFFASLDGISKDGKKVLEVKSTESDKRIESFKKEIPTDWLSQVQWAMMCSGATQALIACVDRRTGQLFTREIAYDQDYALYLCQEADHFWNELCSLRQVSSVSVDDENLRYISEMKKTVSEYQKLIDAEEEKIKELSEGLLKKYNANCIFGHGVKIEFSERKGNIDYSKIEALKDLNLEVYRKPSSRFVKITVEKQKKETT